MLRKLDSESQSILFIFAFSGFSELDKKVGKVSFLIFGFFGEFFA